jgi:hypothetical protein
MTTATIKFNIYNVSNGTAKASVFYSLDNRVDGRKCVTIYAKDYGRELGKIFANDYENRTDTQTDYFDKGNVTLFEGHELYAAARARAEANQQRDKERWAVKAAKRH